jgi:hypothetical protein
MAILQVDQVHFESHFALKDVTGESALRPLAKISALSPKHWS